MEERRDRFVIGVTGGIAYRLFQAEHIKPLPEGRPMGGSLDEIDRLKFCCNQIGEYLENARSLAPYAVLVGIEERTIHSPLGTNIVAPGVVAIRDIGLGHQTINDLANFQRYLASVKEGLSFLDRNYAEIMEVLDLMHKTG